MVECGAYWCQMWRRTEVNWRRKPDSSVRIAGALCAVANANDLKRSILFMMPPPVPRNAKPGVLILCRRRRDPLNAPRYAGAASPAERSEAESW